MEIWSRSIRVSLTVPLVFYTRMGRFSGIYKNRNSNMYVVKRLNCDVKNYFELACIESAILSLTDGPHVYVRSPAFVSAGVPVVPALIRAPGL